MNNLHNVKLSELYDALQAATDRELHSFMSDTAKSMVDRGLVASDSLHWSLANFEFIARTHRMPESPETIY